MNNQLSRVNIKLWQNEKFHLMTLKPDFSQFGRHFSNAGYVMITSLFCLKKDPTVLQIVSSCQITPHSSNLNKITFFTSHFKMSNFQEIWQLNPFLTSITTSIKTPKASVYHAQSALCWLDHLHHWLPSYMLAVLHDRVVGGWGNDTQSLDMYL